MKMSITSYASAIMSPLLKASMMVPRKVAKIGREAPISIEHITPPTNIILSVLSVNLNKEEKLDLTLVD